MRFVPSVLFVLFAACDGGPTEEETAATEDVKVDHAAEGTAVESVLPRSCTADGRIAVVWQDDRDGAPGIWFNASDDAGATWMSADVPLAATGGVGAFAPDIACAGGSIYVVWEDERDGDLRYRNIYANVSSDGGLTWLAEELRLDGDVDGEAMSLGPRVFAVADAAYVAWFDNRDGAYDIYVQATADHGATWLAEPSRVDTDAAGEAYSAWPRLAADDDGRVVVAWEDSRAGGSDIHVNVSTDGGASFGDEDIRLDGGDDEGATNSFLPSLAMSGDHAYVVWHDERNGERDVFLSASADGGASWAAEPVRVDGDAAGQSDAINPVVAAVGDRVHVAWQDDRSGGYDIYHRSSSDGGATWAADEVRMDTDAGGESQSFAPVLLVEADSVLVGWEDRRADGDEVGFNDLYYNYSGDGGGTWSGEDLRINSNAPGSAYAFDLALALSDGAVVAVWADGRNGSSDIFCASRAMGEASRYVAPPEPEEEAP